MLSLRWGDVVHQFISDIFVRLASDHFYCKRLEPIHRWFPMPWCLRFNIFPRRWNWKGDYFSSILALPQNIFNTDVHTQNSSNSLCSSAITRSRQWMNAACLGCMPCIYHYGYRFKIVLVNLIWMAFSSPVFCGVFILPCAPVRI